MKSYNKYDIFIFLLIASLAGGQIGGALQIPRLLAILFLPTMLNVRKSCFYYIGSIRNYIVAFIVYAVLSLAWTLDLGQGVKNVTYLIVHFLLFFEILVFARFAKNPTRAVVAGWVAFLAVCLSVSGWELLTDNHLSYSKQQGGLQANVGGGEIINRSFSSATFFNYNDYCTVLCFALPWMFYGLVLEGSSRMKLLLFACVLFTSVVIFYNASRGAAISLLVYALIYIIFCPSKKIKYFTILLFIFGLVFLAKRLPDLFAFIGARTSAYSVFQEESRFSIWMDVLNVYGKTLGIGTGAGGIVESMRLYGTQSIYSPHNLLLEIMLQYNIIFAIIFIVYLLRLLRRTRTLKDKEIRMLLLMVLIAFIPYSIISSGYLESPSLFAFFACVFVFSNLDTIRLDTV